jgi:hypothetical protein
MSNHDLLAMPYSERRIIVVRDDAPSDEKTRKPAMLALRFVASIDPATNMVLRAVDLFNARREMRHGGETLLPVSSIEAAQLHFPVGHPRGKVAYIGHPIDAPVYIPVADFHRFLFEHKVAEALRLIRFLGAVTVEVVRIEGWDQSIGVQLGVTLPDVSQANVGVSASRERATGRSLLSTMRLKPTQSPAVPPGLVWLPHEPLWQEVAQARLESGLDSFVLDVRSTDDYGVNAGLKALVAKAGLEAGGAFVEHRNTIWRLQGTFS